MSHSLQDHSSLIRDSTQALEVKSPSFNHWMPRNSQDTDNLSLFIDDAVRFFWLRDAHSLFSLPHYFIPTLRLIKFKGTFCLLPSENGAVIVPFCPVGGTGSDSCDSFFRRLEGKKMSEPLLERQPTTY